MTTSRPIKFLSEIVDGLAEGKPIPLSTLAYFRERLLNRFHSLLIKEFLRQNSQKKFTQSDFARRIGRAPEQINRWLASGGNWTIETISDLFIALGAELGPIEELEVAFLQDRLSPKSGTASAPAATANGAAQQWMSEMNRRQPRRESERKMIPALPTGGMGTNVGAQQ